MKIIQILINSISKKRTNLLRSIKSNKLKYHTRNKLKMHDIIIGFATSNLGGLPHHMQALHFKSSLNTCLIPSQSMTNKLRATSDFDLYKIIFSDQLKKQSIKIVHSHVDPWFINTCLSLQNNGTRWIHTYHTLYFEKDWNNGLQPWQIEINNSLINVARNADVRIAISFWLQKFLLEKYSIETLYIPNGVDVSKCDKADANRFIEKYNLKDFVLFASGISDIKNPGKFIKLAHAIPEKQFVIIGRQISVEALMEKYKITLPTNLKVIGQMPHEELLDAIAACNVFVVTSRSEGLPTVLMEAMALERTVIGCDTYGTKEVIGDEQYGYIYDHSSFDDLVAKTKDAINKSKGKEARKRILENYDWHVIIPQIDDIYTKLL